ncbi:MAG: TatD family hydrolase [Bacteroidetes bacterium]|nr:TatD family hydrolase [Bacteroidota bacterium]
MNFVDTHTHLYAEEFDPDRDAAVQHAIAKGVDRLLLPAIDRSYYERMMQVAMRYPQTCFPMIGLHPTSVKADYREELDFIRKMLENNRETFLGIGEIGIDLYWDKTFADEQTAAFSDQLDLAVEYRLPAAIHTRNSFDIAIGVIRQKNNPGLKGVFHCFGGSAEQAQQATELGFMLGIGGIITYKNSGLQKVVEATGLEHLLLETDAPYLPPVPYRGQRNESAYIPLIAAKVAEIKKLPVEEVAEITTRNAEMLFKLMLDAGC